MGYGDSLQPCGICHRKAFTESSQAILKKKLWISMFALCFRVRQKIWFNDISFVIILHNKPVLIFWIFLFYLFKCSRYTIFVEQSISSILNIYFAIPKSILPRFEVIFSLWVMFLTLMMNLSTIKGKISLSSDDRQVTLWNFELWPWEDQVSLLDTTWYYSHKTKFVSAF